jgi:hypothetical protein
MSAFGVVLIAFANTGLILLCTTPSKMLVTCGDDLVEVLKDDLPHFASQTRSVAVFKILGDIETVRMYPILALGISLCRVYVHWFIALVRIRSAAAIPARRESLAWTRSFSIGLGLAGESCPAAERRRFPAAGTVGAN